MATNNHRLSTHAYPEPMRCNCHMSPKQSGHPLSKSSSNLHASAQYGADFSQSRKQELHKSLSSIVCQPRALEHALPYSHGSLWSPSLNEGVVSSCGNQMPCSLLSPGNGQSSAKASNHFLTVDRSAVSWDCSDVRIHIRSSTAENVSAVGDEETMVCKTHSADPLEETGLLVQKSRSEFMYGCGDPSHAVHHRTSATYSDFSPANNMYEPAARDQSFHSQMYDLAQNRTELLISARDQNISPVSFASDAIQHDITVYTSPGTLHRGIARQQDHGVAYPDNRILNSQSSGNLGGAICNSSSCTVRLSPVVTIHEGCAAHCHMMNEACIHPNDTVAAYCHSMPIPAIQLAPRLACSSVNQSGREQIAPGFCLSLPISDIVTYPKLACSISESGLDARRLMRCGSNPGEGSPLLCKERTVAGGPELSRTESPVNISLSEIGMEMNTKTRDTWTMTAMDSLAMFLKPANEYKDAGVQTAAVLETKSAATSPSPLGGLHTHLFPEVSLKLDLQDSPTPVREVRWDDEGMTWEVYGASVDPEVLGLAIQKHLEIQIEEHLKPTEPTRKNSGVHLSKEEKRRSFRTIMYSLRRSSCCVRSSASVE